MVEGLVVAQQRARARLHPERPFGAARLRAFAQTVERGGGLVRLSVADAGLDQLDEGPAVRHDVLVLARLPRGRERLAVLAVAVVQQRGKTPVQAERGAFAARRHILQPVVGERLHLRLIAARRGQHARSRT